MKQFCDTVFIQNVLLKAYNNEKLQAKNIIGVLLKEIPNDEMLKSEFRNE